MKTFKSSLIGILALVVLLAGLQLVYSGTAHQEPLIPRSLLFGNPVKAAPQLSPDGRQLAYLAPDSNNVLNVWIKDLQHPDSDKKITSDNKQGITSYSWQYDNKHILYSQDADGNEDWHLYQTDIDTLETKQLTPFEGIQVHIISYEPEYPDEMLIGMNKRDPKFFDVYRLNLKTGDLTLELENTDQALTWVADHELHIRAAEMLKDNGDILIRVKETKDAPWKDLLEIPAQELGNQIAGFTPDNQSIYFLTSLKGETVRLLKIDLKTGEQELIAEDPRFDINGIMQAPLTDELEAITIERERPDWIVVDSKIAPDFQFLKEQLKAPVLIVSRNLENTEWVVGALSDHKPMHFYLYDRSKKSLEFLFTTRPELEKYKLNPMQPISFKARDGMELHGYLTLPSVKIAKNLPTVIVVHGGPWDRDSWGYDPVAQWLSNRGYAVFQVNFRGSTGYGKAYLNAGNREWGAKMHDDILDAKKWLVNNDYANPNKIALYGGSYGGYEALVGLAFTPDEFCCAVDIVGPSNLITLLQTLPPYWSPLKADMDIKIGNLETDKEFLISRSPLFKADQIRKPLLIAQGANDPRVKQAESDQVVEAMRKKNLPVEYLLFPDEGHGFSKPDNRLKFFAAAEAFLAKYLGGREEPPSKSEDWNHLLK